MKSGKRKLGWGLAAILLVSLLLSGCGSASNDANSASDMATANNAAVSSESSKASYGEGESAADMNNSPAAASGADGGAAEQPAAAPQMGEPGGSALTALDRKLIYNAQVAMEVEEYGKAQTELFNLVTLSRGYMLSFNDSQSTYELGGVFVIKVPSNGFQSFLAKLEELKKGDTYQRSVQGQDVTEEYVDLTSRLKAKQVVESRLLSFMEKATDTKDLLQFSNELARVQEEIEALKGRMRYIDQNVSFSTVELRMYQVLKPKEKDDDDEKRNVFLRAGSAMKESAEALIAFLEGLLVVLAAILPVAAILAIIAIPLLMYYRKSRRSKPKTIQQPIEQQRIDPDSDPAKNKN